MSEALILRLPFDSPWRRLPIVLPLAVGLSVLALLTFLSVLGRVAPSAMTRKPIEAQIVVIPPATKPEAVPKPIERLSPPRPMHEVHEVRPRPVRRLSPKPKATTAVAVPVDHTPVPRAGNARPVPPVPETAGTAPRAGSIGHDRMSARAVFKPLPQIPDELREHALDTVAVVRFSVAIDGSAKAVLVRPTAIPRLNLLLLQAFSRWRFFPALENGKPVASVVDLTVPIKIE
jgi:periplasmic protein TonB